MSKKILSVLLVLIMVISMIPVSVFAATEENVYISVSFDGNYLTAGTGTHKGKPMVYLPVTLKVLKNTVKLASFGLENYIYDADGDGAEDITALHLLVYAHEKIFGTKWKNNVTVSGEAGNLTVQSGLFGLTANMAYNLNGTVNATSLDRIVLQGGDFMDVAGYTGEDFSTQPLAGFRYFVDEQNKITHKYTAKLNDPLTVSLTPAAENAVFYSRTLLDPNAKTVTTDVNGKAAITLDTCGTWYVWSLGDGDSAPAYAEIFVPWKNTDNTTAYWPNFRNSLYNMAITDTKTPVSAATTVAKWIVSKGTSWTDTPSGMIIADNALIFMGQTTITKADLQTGEVLATNKMNGNGGFNIISPTYGDGLIFCPLTGGRIEAFNAKTLESVWVFVDTVGGQNNTPITYHDGYVYTGYWNGEAKDGNFVCVNAATGELVWSKTTLGGHYWSGSVVIGDAVIVGTDDGASGWEGDSHLYALNRLTGEVISDITLTGMGDQRSTIAYSTEKGRIYFTTKNGYIASAAVNTTTGALSDLKCNKISSQATATPVVYGDKVYVGAGGGMQVGATKGNLFAVDANTLEYLYEVPLLGYPQGSILISTAYLAETGKLYCYATYNSAPGGMTLIKIDPNATTADGAELEEIFDAGTHPQYCLISPICGPDGTIYYRNDSGCLFALTTNNSYLTGISASVGTFTKEFAPGRHEYELVVPVGTQSVTFTPTACEGGVTQAVTVTLVDGAATATMVVTKGGDSRTYTVTVRSVSQNASLGSLKVNQTNSYGGTVSPEVTPEEHYYTFLTAGDSRTFMNVWPDVAESHASLKVFLMDNAAGKNEKEIAEDGSLKVTATSNGHDRYAVYFADGNKPMAVRIEVTSENGEVDNYYLVISKPSAAEDGKALLERIKADNNAAADKTAADAVSEKINTIGTVTLESKAAIEAARSAYDALTDAQKALVTDINYQVAALEDKKQMFFGYSAILNSMDSGATYKITERKRHMTEYDIAEGVLMSMQQDGLDDYRKEYNNFLLDRAIGKNGSFLKRYLTVSVPKRNIQDARNFFARIGPELSARFAELGSHFRELDAMERLQILHGFYRPEDSEYFCLDLDHAMRMGYDFRDYICPDSMEKHKDYLMIGSRYARTFYLKGLASYIRDDILDEFTSLNCDLMLSIDVLPIQTEEAVREVENRLLGVEKNLSDWQRRQNQNRNYTAQPPYDMELQRRETKEMLDDLTTRDQRMMFATITMVITADSKEQLDSLSDTLRCIAQNRMCQIVPLTFQQMDGLNTVLPIGPRKIYAMRTLTTESLAVFMPFKVQEIQEKGGMYFGENAISHNLILCNKQNLQNQATVIFGVPGSGKSFLTKEQIFMLIANTDDDIMICDPEGEYAPLIEAMGDVGTVLRIRAGGKDRLNAMYMVDGYGDSNPVVIKSEFIMSLIEQIDKDGVGPQHKSIIDRCVSALYKEGKELGYTPTLSALRMKLMEQPEQQAQDIALALELFTTGSLDIFGHGSNVDLDKRVTVFDIHGLGPQLKPAGLLVITDTMLNRVTLNWKRGKRTHVFIDEFHVVFENEFSATFFSSAWRQFRKRNAYPTAITQNVEYLLDSVEASSLVSNSELVVMLNQAASDREKLGKLLNISPEQMSYITNADAGCGLIKYGSSLVPFVNRFPKNTKLYELMTTTPGEGVFSKGGR